MSRRPKEASALKVADRRTLVERLRHRVSRDPLLRSVREAAAQARVPVWLVGGYVRDTALGRKAEDVDLAAGRGALKLVRALESEWKRRGFRFRKRGVTTWRFRVGKREVDLVDAGRRGLEEDLRRREFTLNALAFDLLAGGLRDPLGGLRDLRAGRLRLPREEVIREDPIRALRAVRFLAQFPEFELHPTTRREVLGASRGLRRASAERVREELNRILTAPAPSLGLEALERLDLLGATLPELLPLRSCIAGRARPHIWRHTLDALALSSRPGRLPGAGSIHDSRMTLTLRWALLLHDIAKPETLLQQAGGRPTFHGHEVLGARRAGALLRRLRQPRWLHRRVSRLILFHLRPHHMADANSPPRGMRRLVREAGEDLPLLLVHAACDAKASGAPDAASRWRRLRRVLMELLNLHERSRESVIPPLLTGSDVMEVLGIQPGPAVGRLLHRVRELQEEGVLHDRRQALEMLRAGGAQEILESQDLSSR